jgi:integrase
MAEQSRLSFYFQKGIKEMAKSIRGRNEGSISKRPNGKWRAQLSLNGKRISFGSESKEECQVWLRKMLDNLDRGMDYEGGKTNLKDYLASWLDATQITLRPKTAYQYAQIIRLHIIPYLGETILKDLRQSRVELFFGELIKAGVGTRTIRLTHSVLHRALEKALSYGLILRNPAHGAALPRRNQTEMSVLDESQVSQFLVAAHNSQHEALYHLAVTTGMRQAELLGLKWSDLQWISGTLHVRRQVQHVPGQGWSFIEPKTRAGRRAIELGEGSLQVLRQHLERQQLQKLMMGQRWKENNLIFPSSVGTPITLTNLRMDFNQVLDQAGIPRVRFHDLRHTAASLMLNHGIPVIVVSKILGHSKPSVTLDIYGHLYHEMQTEAAQIMDRLVTPIEVDLPKTVSNQINNIR